MHELGITQNLALLHGAQANGALVQRALAGCVALGPLEHEAVRLGGQHGGVLVLPQDGLAP